MAELCAQHTSMRDRWRTPRGMTRTTMPEDQREFLDNYAISIFTDCVNAGHTFQAALSAIYLSGLQNGLELAKDSP